MSDWVPQFWGGDAGHKVICTTCGRTGADCRGPDGKPWSGSWMTSCFKPHTFKCKCGKAFPVKSALSNHLSRLSLRRLRSEEHGRLELDRK